MHTNRKEVFCSFPVHWDLHEMNNLNSWANSDFQQWFAYSQQKHDEYFKFKLATFTWKMLPLRSCHFHAIKWKGQNISRNIFLYGDSMF